MPSKGETAGPSSPGSGGPNAVQMMQAQVDEVKCIMADGLEKAKEREGNLHELDERAEKLEEMADEFKKTSKKLKKQQCLKNYKWTIILVAVMIVVLLLAIAALSVWWFHLRDQLNAVKPSE